MKNLYDENHGQPPRLEAITGNNLRFATESAMDEVYFCSNQNTNVKKNDKPERKTEIWIG